MRKLSVLLGICLFGFAVIGAPPKDVLVVGIRTSIIVDLEPARAYEDVTNLVIEQLYDNLVDYEGGTSAFEAPKPGLAESWEVSDDGYTWIFHLRKGVKFHSGNEFTADDVVYSFRRALALDFAPIWMLSQYVPEPEMIQKIDDYTVAITFNTKLGEYNMAAIMGVQGICGIVDSKLVQEHATPDDPWAYKWLQEHDAGSGPFKLVEWVRNDRVVLTRFDDYWEGPAKLRMVILKDIPEPAAQKLALDKGDIDIAWDLLPEQVDEYRGKAGFLVVEAPAWSLEYVAMNASKPPFDKEEVRDAIRWAINYKAIIEGIVKGAAIPWQTFIPKGIFAALDEQPYYQDLDRAKRLLEAAGYPDGFEVELLTTDSPRRVAEAVQIQADLAKIGIKANIRQMVAAQFYELYRAQKHVFLVAGWGVDYADPDSLAKPFAHCCTTGPDAEVRQLAWRNMYVDCDTSIMVEKAASELDIAKREAMYKEIQRRVLDKGPYAILYQPVSQRVLRDVVKGFELPPNNSYLEFWGVWKEG
ncbi:ABC transporter substrate-binding protein [Thermococci archaeon]|nr:MAG: ABC transporter substrate-binding protein [Thermococci archaeon]